MDTTLSAAAQARSSASVAVANALELLEVLKAVDPSRNVSNAYTRVEEAQLWLDRSGLRRQHCCEESK